ncbi:type IV secretion system protein VirD4 [Mycolicibacterium goodii]|uniref:type IV secretion system protein VirD4 n=1 Tax=Mycolicibacterium goodii TaxID=134601 RepID=UPI00093D32F0|nr:type IV secretion system protein VirD4 [Mycolicibacterium goodii]MBU8840631.1 type IV secretion system protein VirD4 [Mycolicibacterium goodii]OKH72755.1 type IV secretory protein VirD4 [Mycobacterium sp. SWH-M5]
MVSADPAAEVNSAHAAIVQAEILLRVGRAGLGRDRPADVWDVQAVRPLAALLFAASPLGNGLGIEWVRAALDNVDPEDVLNPGWAQAALMCSMTAGRLGRSVVAILTCHPADRDAIVAAVRAAVQGRDRVQERRCG